MNPSRSFDLVVPGARISYQTHGAGPFLLLIHGSGGSARSYSELMDTLTAHYTVITYDRRGHGQSALHHPEFKPTMAEHGDDARRILDDLGIQSAYVFGCSAGGIVGLELAARCPQRVKALVVHEPPLFELLPDAGFRGTLEEIRALEGRSDLVAAAAKFLEVVRVLGPAPGPMLQRFAEAGAAQRPSMLYELEVTLYAPDLEALRSTQFEIAVAAGEAEPESLPYRASEKLAALLGTPLRLFPGNHFGCVTFPPINHPRLFGERLVSILDGQSTAAEESSQKG